MTSLGLSAALAAVGRLGLRSDPYLSLNFLVEIQGLVVGGFSEVSGLQVETSVETYREGGVNEFEHHFAGPTRYPANLALRHGLTDIETLWNWHQDVTRGVFERRNVTVYLLDTQSLPGMWWDVVQALPVRWTGPELRAEAGTVAVEAVELVHRGISKPQLSSAVSAARGALQALPPATRPF